MNIEEKNLLLKDLCARFIYGVIVRVYDNEHGDFDSYVDNISNSCIETHPVEELTTDFNPYVFYKLQEIKPYLRPISSMTEEEKKEFNSLINGVEERCINAYGKGGYTLAFIEVNDWLNKHHFDYRGLIEKGLAIEAPDSMYK